MFSTQEFTSYDMDNQRLGIRRFAKACTKNIVGWGKYEKDECDTHSPKTHDTKEDTWGQDFLKNTANRSHRAKNPLGVNNGILNTLSAPMRELAQDIKNLELHPAETLSTPATPDSLTASSKDLILTGFPINVGINMILDSISGGPLETVYPEVTEKGKDTIITSVYVCFLKSQDAQEFYVYSQTGLFRICQNAIKAQWLNQNYIHSPISGVIEDEVEKGASRCLVLKKVDRFITTKKSRPELCNLNIQELHDDFSQFGQIAEITPAISRKLCVSIHYFDIRSAIFAKDEQELTGSEINLKYSDWKIWYGKDPTDRPCLKI